MLHSQNWSREDSRGFIRALETEITKAPLKINLRDKTHSLVRQWNADRLESLNHQLWQYLQGKGRLQI